MSGCQSVVPVLMTVMSIIGNGHSRSSWSSVFPAALIPPESSERSYRIKINMYVQSSEAIGHQQWRTMLRHILPNIMAPIIINFTIVSAAQSCRKPV